MVYKRVHDELYGADALFFSGCSMDVVHKRAKRAFKIQEDGLEVERTDAGAFFVCTTPSGLKVYIIWIEKNRDVPNMGHEIVHLVSEIFKDRGIPLSYQNSEAFAYYLAFWLEKFLQPKRKRR